MLLREIRESKGLTQAELSRDAGVSQPVISSIECKPNADPKWSTVCRIAYALGERPELIFGLPLPFKVEKEHLLKLLNREHRFRPRRSK